jgi:5,10-methylenetetrahydrofolate reductase
MAKYMNQNVAGVTVPNEIIDVLADTPKEDRPKRSLEFMAEIIQKIKPMCQGLHLMPMGWEKHLPTLLDACDL